MDAGLITALAVLAVLGFWVVGAYNRLQRLRNAAALAYARFDALWAERLAAAAQACDAAARRGSERDAVELARAALRQATSAAEAARAKPLQRRTMLGVAMAAQVLQAALDALRLREAGRAFAAPAAMPEPRPAAPSDSGADAVPQPATEPPTAAHPTAAPAPGGTAAPAAPPAWDDVCAVLDAQAAGLAVARADYDASAAAYNEAAAQFPTRVVAMLFSLGAASTLDPQLPAESTLEAPTAAP